MSEITNPYQKGYYKFLRGIWDDFVETFTLHGVNRIFEKNLSFYKRIVWVVGFLICLAVFGFVSCQVSQQYNTKPLFSVVAQTHLPVYEIPFPEVTICNRNRFNWQRYEQAILIFLKPEHQNNSQYLEIFRITVNAYDTLKFGKLQRFQNLSSYPHKKLMELNYINFSLVAEFMAWRCHEIFSNCIWLDQVYDCCDIFFQRKSQMGMCLAFNSIESDEGLDKQIIDPFWPWRTTDHGSQDGLKLRVHLNEFAHSPWSRNQKGIMVMLTETHVWFTSPIEVNTHSRTSISMTAILHTFDNYTRILSSNMRKCLFDDELNSKNYRSLPSHRYMVENCYAQCQQEYLVRYCNCTMDLFYPRGSFRPCKLSDYPCLFHHNSKLKYFKPAGESKYATDHYPDAMKCGCIHSCRSLTYIPKVSIAYMNNMEVVLNNTYIDLEVFFQQEFIIQYLTTVEYTWADLMSSFGGLAGLCIGCSIISVVEFIYFLVIDIPFKTANYRKKRCTRLLSKSSGIKLDIVESIMRNK